MTALDAVAEANTILAAAGGDAALFCALVALRRTEHGGPGREFGVLSEAAPTFADQLRVAKISFVHHEARCYQGLYGAVVVRDAATGLYTEGFLRTFSARWAPIGADNDPSGLNANHATNLVRTYQDAAGLVLQAARQALA